MPYNQHLLRQIEWLFPLRGRWLVCLLITILVAAVVGSAFADFNVVPAPWWHMPFDPVSRHCL